MTEQQGAFGDGIKQDDFSKWVRVASQAWHHAARGDFKTALGYYEEAEALAPRELTVAPALSLLRHAQGDPKVSRGRPIPMPPTEDQVVTLGLDHITLESPDAWGLAPLQVHEQALAGNIQAFIRDYEPGYHRANITKDMPHVMVLSAGRSGTVSLYHLFERSRLIPYHSYWWKVPNDINYEMMCRLVVGDFSTYRGPHYWAQTRAAEWLGCMMEDRPMVALNHLDTIFAPAFAAIHPEARFVYLHRDPQDVFVSFFNKQQWSDQQLCPLYCSFDPEFHWRRRGLDEISQMAWYIKFTEVFCRAVGEVLGDRFIEISADKLFAQDAGEVSDLLSFTSCDMALATSVNHFARKYNEKIHKQEMSMEMMARPTKAFWKAYEEEL